MGGYLFHSRHHKINKLVNNPQVLKLADLQVKYFNQPSSIKFNTIDLLFLYFLSVTLRCSMVGIVVVGAFLFSVFILVFYDMEIVVFLVELSR